MFPQAWTDELSSEHVPLLFYKPSILRPKEYSFNASADRYSAHFGRYLQNICHNTTIGREILDAKRLKIDSGKHNCVFIVGPFNRRIGVIKDNYYFQCMVRITAVRKDKQRIIMIR